MNRLTDRFRLEGDPVLDTLGKFITHYRSQRTEEEKQEADSITYGFIDSQVDDPLKRTKYRRVYLFATGRTPKRPPSTRFIRDRQSVN